MDGLFRTSTTVAVVRESSVVPYRDIRVRIRPTLVIFFRMLNRSMAMSQFKGTENLAIDGIPSLELYACLSKFVFQ